MKKLILRYAELEMRRNHSQALSADEKKEMQDILLKTKFSHEEILRAAQKAIVKQ